MLIYSVGLITADEVAFAGGVGGTSNTSYYLYTNQNYWTMSPSTATYAHGFIVYSYGAIASDLIDGSSGIRPVINIRNDVGFTGSGTATDPYIIA